jgi:hypothetical protein
MLATREGLLRTLDYMVEAYCPDLEPAFPADPFYDVPCIPSSSGVAERSDILRLWNGQRLGVGSDSGSQFASAARSWRRNWILHSIF